jgi:hypothetical protein
MPEDQPLRAVRKLTDKVLHSFDAEGTPKRPYVSHHSGPDKAYGSEDFVRTVRELNVTPHVIRKDNMRRSNLDRRTTRHRGYGISISSRWLVEKGFDWLKQIGPVRPIKMRGLQNVDWLFVFSCVAHNLLRLPKLMTPQPPRRSAPEAANQGLRS